MRAQDAAGGGAALAEAERQPVPDVATHELHERVLGGTVEPRDLEGRQPQTPGSRDPVLPVDDRPVVATHHDRRPCARQLGQGGDMARVEPLDPQGGADVERVERELRLARDHGSARARRSGLRHLQSPRARQFKPRFDCKYS